jgi:NADPH:quinone reductase
MRAITYERTGAARDVLRLRELPTPEPGPGEVRVRIAWSGVNPSDVKQRAGRRTRTLAYPRIIPHSDGAGVIDQVGPGVDPVRINERVWVWNAAWQRAEGTAAEYVVVPGAQAVALPECVSLEAGACLGIPALTAYHAVQVNGGVAGRQVLVAGGAGAVGHYAIQIARLCGAARVIATVSGEAKAAAARHAGADVIINYREEHVAARVAELTQGRGVDRLIEVDGATNIDLDLELLGQDADLVVYGSGAEAITLPFFPAILKNVRMQFFIVYALGAQARAEAIAGLSGLLGGAALLHPIAARFTLERTAEAHELVESALAIGNVIIGAD